ncbi:nutritionally-regulated adipose and cardiac enriched protein homolog [Sceloporus undulatus]|uniref:nutritionally-regulated adipose and cardiac enriched protein homolog n=1 Tax=Sceloporus undulatus TaxID=8520 RepID=UPI001C4CE29D|nr:nutritionally-regulated adipose and cardiac enriched protein homolog [Sceloporus undulatus]
MYKKEKTHYTKYPPSILRKRSSMNQGVSNKQRAKRRVRFQEPEEIVVYAHEKPASILPLILGILLCCVLLLSAVSLYYTSMRQNLKVLEEFHSQLVIVLLQIRHIALKCWTWLVRQ